MGESACTDQGEPELGDLCEYHMFLSQSVFSVVKNGVVSLSLYCSYLHFFYYHGYLNIPGGKKESDIQ